MYEHSIQRFESEMDCSLEGMLEEAVSAETLIEQRRILREHAERVDEYADILLKREYSRKTVKTYVAPIASAYHHNDLRLPVTPLKAWAKHPVEPLTLEHVRQMLDVANTRDRFTILGLASSGLRVGEFVQLVYADVKEDFEAGIVPVRVQVRQEIAKGRYMGRTTFFNSEACKYLGLYLEERRLGSLRNDGWGKKAETIADSTPLLRNEHLQEVKPVSRSSVFHRLHRTMIRAGLFSKKEGEGLRVRYRFSVHSLRRLFETHMIDLGVEEKYVQFYMGHVQAMKDPYFKPTQKQLADKYRNGNFRIYPEVVTTEDLEKTREEIRREVLEETTARIDVISKDIERLVGDEELRLIQSDLYTQEEWDSGRIKVIEDLHDSLSPETRKELEKYRRKRTEEYERIKRERAESESE